MVVVGGVAAIVYGELKCAEQCVGGDIRNVAKEACDGSMEPDPDAYLDPCELNDEVDP